MKFGRDEELLETISILAFYFLQQKRITMIRELEIVVLLLPSLHWICNIYDHLGRLEM
jgi:hypothetical protein